MQEFVPSEYDKEWTKHHLDMIADGGVWVTSAAIYKKIDKTTLAVVMRNDLISNTELIEEDIERVKIVCKAIGVKFIDISKQ